MRGAHTPPRAARTRVSSRDMSRLLIKPTHFSYPTGQAIRNIPTKLPRKIEKSVSWLTIRQMYNNRAEHSAAVGVLLDRDLHQHLMENMVVWVEHD